jgi:hypothetical protein
MEGLNDINYTIMEMNDPITYTTKNCTVNQGKTDDWTNDLWIIKTNYGTYDPETTLMEGLIVDSNKKVYYVGLTTLKEYSPGVKTTRVEELIEGTKIGVFYKEGEWRFATNRMINAFESFWHDRNMSFGDMAKECFADFDFGQLNQKYAYTFVIRHPKNLSISKTQKPEIYQLCTRDLETLKEVEHFVLPRPRVFEGLSSIMDYLGFLEENPDVMGFIMSGTDGQKYKIESDRFRKMKELKGNTPNIVFQYLQIRTDPDKKALFMEFFPSLQEKIDEIEKKITTVSEKIHYQYCGQHILKNGNPINPRFTSVIKEIHKKHRETKMPTSKENVYKIVSNSAPERVMFLINSL